jgi:hypothetical protein
MNYIVSFLTIVAATFVTLRSHRPKEMRLVLSRTIHRPASSVFDIVGAVDRVPVWRRMPGWSPGFLKISVMSGWGEHFAPGKRGKGAEQMGPEEIRIRHIRNREFAYLSIRPKDLSYESTFRIVPADIKCQLVWEIRFRVSRVPDILRRRAIAAAVCARMSRSLDYIQHIAMSSADCSRRPDRMFATRRDHVPAA